LFTSSSSLILSHQKEEKRKEIENAERRKPPLWNQKFLNIYLLPPAKPSIYAIAKPPTAAIAITGTKPVNVLIALLKSL